MRNRKYSWIALAAATLALLTSCGTLDYNAISRKSVIDGRLFVMWVGEGAPDSGDGKFVFVPNPRDPLRMTRYDKTGAQVGPVLQPGIMYTDGGSIPRIATVFKGFSPWGYAPAYMIHDWLFIAKHCVTDGTATTEQAKIAGMSFQTSAIVIAEAIAFLEESRQVARNDIAPAAISSAVAGPISRRQWERKGACAGHAVSEAHKQAVLAAFPPQLQKSNRRLAPRPGPRVTPAVVIGEFGFR